MRLALPPLRCCVELPSTGQPRAAIPTCFVPNPALSAWRRSSLAASSLLLPAYAILPPQAREPSLRTARHQVSLANSPAAFLSFPVLLLDARARPQRQSFFHRSRAHRAATYSARPASSPASFPQM